MADDGPDLSCFDFASSGDDEESREDVLKRHMQEEEQLRAEAKAKKKAIEKSDKPARRACEAELAEALDQLAARHAKELGGVEDAAGAEAMAALAVSEAKQGKSAKRRQKREQEEREREQRMADEKAGAGPSQRELEMAQLEQQLQPLGRQIVEIPADGHCLYRSVAQQLMQHGPEGVEEDYSGCRRLAAAYIRSHPGDFLPYIAAEGMDMGTYTQQVEGSSEWGGAPRAAPRPRRARAAPARRTHAALASPSWRRSARALTPALSRPARDHCARPCAQTHDRGLQCGGAAARDGRGVRRQRTEARVVLPQTLLWPRRALQRCGAELRQREARRARDTPRLSYGKHCVKKSRLANPSVDNHKKIIKRVCTYATTPNTLYETRVTHSRAVGCVFSWFSSPHEYGSTSHCLFTPSRGVGDV